MANKVFGSHKLHGNVVLNTKGKPKYEFGIYARQYQEAANVLADNFNDKVAYNDVAAAPIVFLYRHSIELYLKQVIILVRDLLSLRDIKDEGKACDYMVDDILHHKIRDLFRLFKNAFKRLGWYPEDDIFSGINLSSFVSGFSEVDENSFSFRFPAKKKYPITDATLDKNFIFNMPTFAQKADVCCNTLDAAVFAVENEIEKSVNAVINGS